MNDKFIKPKLRITLFLIVSERRETLHQKLFIVFEFRGEFDFGVSNIILIRNRLVYSIIMYKFIFITVFDSTLKMTYKFKTFNIIIFSINTFIP